MILIFIVFSCTLANSQIGPLIWEDNFNQKTLDESKWNYETGTGLNGDWGTGQIDRATDRKKNVAIKFGIEDADSGCLVITTRKDYYENRDYSSGRLNTKDKASFGPGHRIVARIHPRDVKFQGQGFAFWMMPAEKPEGVDDIMWPQGGEVDIMEYVGSIPFHNLASVHYAWSWENNKYQQWNHGHQGVYYSYEIREVPLSSPKYSNSPPPKNDTIAGSAGFHTYGVDWYDDRMEFFVDDTVYHIHYFNDGGAFDKDGEDDIYYEIVNGTRAGISEYSHHFDEWHPFEHEMFLILSAGVGGQNHTYGGPILNRAKFPCSVIIDWVRVYELNDSGKGNK